MDRDRPFYSNYAHGNRNGSSSPGKSPASTFKRPPSVQAASQFLAAAMMKRAADSNEDEDHDDFEFGSPFTSSYSFPHNSNSNVSNAVSGLHTTPATTPERSPSPAQGRNSRQHSQTIRSKTAGRPFISMPSMAPASPIKTPFLIPPIQPPKRKAGKRVPLDARHPNPDDTGNKHEVFALHDEFDVLQGENYSLREKLQQSEEKCSKAEARARELEKQAAQKMSMGTAMPHLHIQVAKLGQGLSLDDELSRRREEFLREREMALKNGRDKEIVALRLKMENLTEDREAAITQLQDVNSELSGLRTIVHRMVLTQDEKEEVVLKRCWLARYWGLAVNHGICTEIAQSRHEYWSSLAPLPFEMVISAGVKAKEESCCAGGNNPDRRKLIKDTSALTGEGYIESLLLVEAGLKELSSLKVEEAVVLAMAQSRSNLVRQSTSSDFIFPGDLKFVDTFELSKEEAEDILFKQAWLTYFWRRAVVHHIEKDIARERLQSWIGQSGQTPTPHDCVEVERGLRELQKLGMEHQLWEASRKLADHPPPPSSASYVSALLDDHDQ